MERVQYVQTKEFQNKHTVTPLNREIVTLVMGAFITAGTLSVAQAWSKVLHTSCHDFVDLFMNMPLSVIWTRHSYNHKKECTEKEPDHSSRTKKVSKKNMEIIEAIVITLIIIILIVLIRRTWGPVSKL